MADPKNEEGMGMGALLEMLLGGRRTCRHEENLNRMTVVLMAIVARSGGTMFVTQAEADELMKQGLGLKVQPDAAGLGLELSLMTAEQADLATHPAPGTVQ